ncbi:hypothetical protein V6Z12_A09G036700 [Gossypium hirsutum]
MDPGQNHAWEGPRRIKVHHPRLDCKIYFSSNKLVGQNGSERFFLVMKNTLVALSLDDQEDEIE